MDTNVPTNKNRIETLDWLRGIAALSIMFFHLSSALVAPQDASTVLGRLGVYGVSIFFILSGLSVAIAYHRYISSLRRVVYFYIRRIFRIWPLLWVVCLLTVLPVLIATGTLNWEKFLLNITTLFGFVSPSRYIATGAWSIGNEMVYYALTPAILLLYNFHRHAGNLFLLLATALGLYFAFFLLDPLKPLGEPMQWNLYVNPFNNFFLYAAGIALYYNFKDALVKTRVVLPVLLAAIIAFTLLPYTGNEISLVTGVGRIVFVVLSVLIVFCFYKLDVTLPQWLSRSLETFGIATYGVYLIHPLVTSYLNIFFDSAVFLYIATVVLTIGTAILSFRYFETPFIALAKKLTSKKIA